MKAWLFGAVAVTLALAWLPAQDAGAAERYVDEVFSSVTVTSNLAYGQAIDEFGQLETLRLDVYRPTGDTLTSRPVVIFVHGGGFTGGNKTSPDAVDYATRMAKRGFVSASINYRLREGGFPPEEQAQVILDAKHDGQASIRWFRANAATYGVDPNKISIAGYSAGSITALFSAYTPDDPGDSGNPGYPSDVSAVIGISAALGELADDVIDPGEPPVMLIHGTADATAPYSNALNTIAAADEAGIVSELHTLQGAGHSKFGPAFMTDMTEWSGVFLFNHVVGGEVGGIAELVDGSPREQGLNWTMAAIVPGALAVVVAGSLLATRRRH
jgi:acetyl esterase/lipase